MKKKERQRKSVYFSDHCITHKCSEKLNVWHFVMLCFCNSKTDAVSFKQICLQMLGFDSVIRHFRQK